MAASAIPTSSTGPEFVAEAVFSMPSGVISDAFTANGHGIAFQELADGRMRLFWDGRAGEPFRGFMELRDKSSAIFTSDDGAHIAYAGGRDGIVFVGRDDLEYPAFEAFSRSVPPVFSHVRRTPRLRRRDGG